MCTHLSNLKVKQLLPCTLKLNFEGMHHNYRYSYIESYYIVLPVVHVHAEVVQCLNELSFSILAATS